MDIPIPSDSGTSGKQLPDKNKVIVIPEPFVGNFAETIGGIAAAHPNKLGGRVGSQLVAAVTNHLYSELQEKKNEVKTLRTLLDTTKDQLYDCKNKVDILDNKVKATGRITLGGNTLITLGFIIIGLGINLLEKETLPSSYSATAIIVGLLTTLSGWVMGTWRWK